MKKLFFVLVFCIGAVFSSITVGAQQDVNLMSDYRDPLWEGDTLYYEEDYGTISFRGESGTASVSFPTEDSLGLWFYFDMGNLSNKGTGYASLEYLDESGNVIESHITEKNSGNGSFNRYQIGSDDEYSPVPDGAQSVRVTISYEGGEQSPYFRNFSLMLSNYRTINNELTDWDVSGKLQIVQVGVTRADHITWIIFVVLAALIMFAVRKFMDKAKKIK